MSKQPPMPPDQRDRVGAGNPETGHQEAGSGDAAPARGRNTKSQGRQGNIKQNTHYQQDR
ncbi:MAG TPA: hypothetical protein VKT30_12415 [Caulobacteraceae bacterium]|nr:hypothetical protein [Caulobacteraceae bacterium]